MTQPTKREQLAAMRLEELKEHLRTMAGGFAEEITGAPRPNPLLVRSAQRAKPQQHRWRKAPGIEVMSLTA